MDIEQLTRINILNIFKCHLKVRKGVFGREVTEHIQCK